MYATTARKPISITIGDKLSTEVKPKIGISISAPIIETVDI
jgi:hypothetical protein